MCGAPEYASPEMLDGFGSDEMTDWWQLGVLMYELIMGHTQFFRRNRFKMFETIKQSPLLYPDEAFMKSNNITITDTARDLLK